MRWFKHLCALWMKLTGWKVYGHLPPEITKGVIIGAGHTSNWDFFYTMGALHMLNINAYFTIKKEWFFFPLNFFFRALGGIPIERKKDKKRKQESYTDAMARMLRQAQNLFLIVTAEGTRKKVEKWRSGFYYTALKAQVPILIGFLNYKTKTAGIAGYLYPTGDYRKDVQYIAQLLQQYAFPKYPDQACLNPRVDD